MENRGAFTVATGLDSGYTRGELRSRRFAVPFHGVRATSDPADTGARARAYATKMRSDAAFTSVTAARLWRMPLPAWLSNSDIHIATPHGTARAGGRGVVGSQFTPGSVAVVDLDGLNILSPGHAWVSLATTLDLADLVAVGDFLVTPGFASSHPPLATLEELTMASSRRRLRGRARAMAAAGLVRVGSFSRPESLTRVLAVTGGLPEPDCNLRVSPLLTFDLAWPQWRLGLDYHGASHRSATQHAKDVSRGDLARQIGWASMQISAPDLFDTPFDVLGRLRSRLAERGAPVRLVHPRQVALARR